MFVRLKLLIGVAVLLAAAVALGLARMRSYVTEDPRYCATCHQSSPEFALWSNNQHGRVSCQKCHHTTLDESAQMLGAFVRGVQPGQSDRQHAPVEIGACAACHLTHDKEWGTQVGASRGHRVHAIDQKITCVRCHAAGVHRFEPPTRICAECHKDRAISPEPMHQFHCLACHDFLSVEASLRPSRRDCLRCHQARGVHPSRFPDTGPMRFNCGACHKPHAATAGALVGCETCHVGISSSGLHGQASHRDCRQCHKPHAWKSEREECLRCHQKEAQASHHADHATCSDCHFWKGSSAPPRPAGGN